MTARDKFGRPIVVVTGMGVLSSLGQGLADNWKALTGGVSGIRRITRFPIDGLRTTIAGTVDFISVPEPSAPSLSQRLAELVMEEAVAEAAIGRTGNFPGPLFLACRRWSWIGPSASPSPPPPAPTRP
jgi:3-oxoacyl-[acyl-carrier-protein] synthase II